MLRFATLQMVAARIGEGKQFFDGGQPDAAARVAGLRLRRLAVLDLEAQPALPGCEPDADEAAARLAAAVLEGPGGAGRGA